MIKLSSEKCHWSVYIFFVIYFLYILQGTLYKGGGSLLSSILCTSIIFFSSICALHTLFFLRKESILFFIYAMVAINVIGYLKLYFFGDEISYSIMRTLKVVLLAQLPFFCGYYWGKKDFLNTTEIKILIVLFFCCCVCYFYSNSNSIIAENEQYKENLTNNVGYYFVLIIPSLIFFKIHKKIFLILLFLCLVFIFASTKRGAIMSAIPCTLYLIYYIGKDNKNFFKILFWVCISISLSYIIYAYYENNLYFQKRIIDTLDGNSSMRDYIYPAIWNNYVNSDSFLNYLFGLGFCAPFTIVDNYAHNDILELLSSFGLLGIFIYFGYFVSAIYFSHKKVFLVEDRIFVYLTLLTIFLMGLTATGYRASHLSIILLGYVIGKTSRLKKLIIA